MEDGVPGDIVMLVQGPVEKGQEQEHVIATTLYRRMEDCNVLE